MSPHFLKCSRLTLISAVVGGVLLSTVGAAVAQDPAVGPKNPAGADAEAGRPAASLSRPPTRPKAAEEQKFIDSVRNRQTRSLSTARARNHRNDREGKAEHRSGNPL